MVAWFVVSALAGTDDACRVHQPGLLGGNQWTVRVEDGLAFSESGVTVTWFWETEQAPVAAIGDDQATAYVVHRGLVRGLHAHRRPAVLLDPATLELRRREGRDPIGVVDLATREAALGVWRYRFGAECTAADVVVGIIGSNAVRSRAQSFPTSQSIWYAGP